MHERLRWLWYEFWSSVLTAGFTLGFSFRAEGRRNIPPRGPALLLANHESFIDPLLVGIAAPRHLWYLARRTAFHGLLGWYLPTVNTIPVNQEGVATDGLRRSLDVLRRSEPILIFPEGQRSWDGVMRPFQPGILLLIRKAAPPIVPVGIAGSFEALPRARRYPIPTLSPLFLPPGRSTLAVSIGRPFDSTRFLDRPREEVLNELFVEVKKMQLQAERLRRR